MYSNFKRFANLFNFVALKINSMWQFSHNFNLILIFLKISTMKDTIFYDFIFERTLMYEINSKPLLLKISVKHLTSEIYPNQHYNRKFNKCCQWFLVSLKKYTVVRIIWIFQTVGNIHLSCQLQSFSFKILNFPFEARFEI